MSARAEWSAIRSSCGKGVNVATTPKEGLGRRGEGVEFEHQYSTYECSFVVIGSQEAVIHPPLRPTNMAPHVLDRLYVPLLITWMLITGENHI